jgi:hypothetical protein
MYKLCFYVPRSHLEIVKTAVFEAGGGRVGDYEACCWQVLGQGQFRPLDNAQPFIGEYNKVTVLPEYRVELVCEDEVVRQAVAAMKSTHPYEQPAYDVWQLADF